MYLPGRKIKMSKKFDGKVALVTGAGSGIGRATAVACARNGAKVVVSDLMVAGGQETVDLIKRFGGEAIFVKTDVSKPAEVEALINKTVATYGRLDCAVNNAGIQGTTGTVLTTDTTEETWDLIMNVNLKGVWLCMKYEIPQMLKQGGGSIVNTASMASIVGFAGLAAYTASKHGVGGLTKSAALEYAKSGIRINAICPGTIRTNMMEGYIASDPNIEAYFNSLTPIGRMGRSEEAAELAIFLCSDLSPYLTGALIPVDGGYTAQ
jgi:NAD(P)-dependent dehydrogenase (short-subunit alcohol dehydrogenase family)